MLSPESRPTRRLPEVNMKQPAGGCMRIACCLYCCDRVPEVHGWHFAGAVKEGGRDGLQRYISILLCFALVWLSLHLDARLSEFNGDMGILGTETHGA